MLRTLVVGLTISQISTVYAGEDADEQSQQIKTPPKHMMFNVATECSSAKAMKQLEAELTARGKLGIPVEAPKGDKLSGYGQERQLGTDGGRQQKTQHRLATMRARLEKKRAESALRQAAEAGDGVGKGEAAKPNNGGR